MEYACIFGRFVRLSTIYVQKALGNGSFLDIRAFSGLFTSKELDGSA